MRASLIPSICVLALVSMFAGSGIAADKKPGGGKDMKEKPKFMNEVIAVDAKSITIYQSPKKEPKYTVTETTKVTLDYKPAKIEDLKPGMKAMVSHKPQTDEATSISAQTVKSGKKK